MTLYWAAHYSDTWGAFADRHSAATHRTTTSIQIDTLTENAAQSRRTVARNIISAVDDDLIEKSPVRDRHKPAVTIRGKTGLDLRTSQVIIASVPDDIVRCSPARP